MTKKEFFENHAYGAYHTKSGERILFNRRYQPLDDRERWVEDIIYHEFFYDEGTKWRDRLYNSANEINIHAKKPVPDMLSTKSREQNKVSPV